MTEEDTHSYSYPCLLINRVPITLVPWNLSGSEGANEIEGLNRGRKGSGVKNTKWVGFSKLPQLLFPVVQGARQARNATG